MAKRTKKGKKATGTVAKAKSALQRAGAKTKSLATKAANAAKKMSKTKGAKVAAATALGVVAVAAAGMAVRKARKRK